MSPITQNDWMKAYIEDEGRLFYVSIIVICLGIIAILSSPFLFNIQILFYACIVLTVISGLYLSKGLSYEDKNRAAGKSREKVARRARRNRTGRRR